MSFSIFVKTIDKGRDVRTEQPLDLVLGGLRVLDRVVKKRRRDRFVVELQPGQDRSDFEGMGEIGIARGSLLLAMRLHRVDIGAIEQSLIRLRIVAQNLFYEIVLPHDWLRSRLSFKLHGLASLLNFNSRCLKQSPTRTKSRSNFPTGS